MNALVTGASKGIGKAIAIALATAGYSVAINFRQDVTEAEKVLQLCNKYSTNNLLIQADVSNERDVMAMVETVQSQYGTLAVLINNVGIFDESDSPTNISVFETLHANNFLSAVLVTTHALSLIKSGKIVNISSIHGRLGHGRPEAAAYAAYKAALENYTKNLAKALAPHILVNAVAPGRVDTPMWGADTPEEQSKLGKAHLIKRMIRPEEVADGVLFLVKNDAICGEVLTIDGGMSLVTLG